MNIPSKAKPSGHPLPMDAILSRDSLSHLNPRTPRLPKGSVFYKDAVCDECHGDQTHDPTRVHMSCS